MKIFSVVNDVIIQTACVSFCFYLAGFVMGGQQPQPKQTATEVVVVKAVSQEDLTFASRREGFLFVSIVRVPAPIVQEYRQRPELVLNALQRLAEDSQPDDSVKAAAYALFLLGDESGAYACARGFDKDKYDRRAEGAKMSQRQYFVNSIKDLVIAKKDK